MPGWQGIRNRDANPQPLTIAWAVDTVVTIQWAKSLRRMTVVVAQLVRASDCGSEGRGFESHQPP
jgi:hypothetical protein